MKGLHLPHRSSQMCDELAQQQRQIDLDGALVDGGVEYYDAVDVLCNVR